MLSYEKISNSLVASIIIIQILEMKFDWNKIWESERKRTEWIIRMNQTKQRIQKMRSFSGSHFDFNIQK